MKGWYRARLAWLFRVLNHRPRFCFYSSKGSGNIILERGNQLGRGRSREEENAHSEMPRWELERMPLL